MKPKTGASQPPNPRTRAFIPEPVIRILKAFSASNFPARQHTIVIFRRQCGIAAAHRTLCLRKTTEKAVEKASFLYRLYFGSIEPNDLLIRCLGLLLAAVFTCAAMAGVEGITLAAQPGAGYDSRSVA